jgi:hypothetical protein
MHKSLINSVDVLTLENISSLYHSCLPYSAILSPLQSLQLSYAFSLIPPSGYYCLVEMIFTSLSFPIRAFVALVVITSSLTSSVNAAAANVTSPARQFLFLGLVNREELY